ncbi:UDP-N-acetyl-D-glucosamine 6-dehydrogenase [Arsenophonus endosymbiont of Bemisia tabaci Q2]|nr:UDP-N-acetyl-D-glucosamine 6-dehydrogenase [Arsenophonus endosymbiont of Bemisia tabaci Q2]
MKLKLPASVFGLAFKPDIDDLRESPSMQITKMIANWHTGITYVVEPNINKLPNVLKGLCQLVSTEVAVANADIILLLVDHKKFKAIKGEQIRQKWVVDTKGVWR